MPTSVESEAHFTEKCLKTVTANTCSLVSDYIIINISACVRQCVVISGKGATNT